MIRLFFKILWAQRTLVLWMGVLAVIATTWAYLKRDVITSYFENRDQRNQTRTEVERLRKEVAHQEEERNTLAKGGFLSEKSRPRNLSHEQRGRKSALHRNAQRCPSLLHAKKTNRLTQLQLLHLGALSTPCWGTRSPDPANLLKTRTSIWSIAA